MPTGIRLFVCVFTVVMLDSLNGFTYVSDLLTGLSVAQNELRFKGRLVSF